MERHESASDNHLKLNGWVDVQSKKYLLPLSGLASLFLLLGCQNKNLIPADVTEAFNATENVTLYSLEPRGVRQAGPNSMHSFEILGNVDLKGAPAADAFASFSSAAAHWTRESGYGKCFNPRQALRVTSQGHTYDLLICYECAGMRIYEGAQQISSLGVNGSPNVLNRLLTAAHVAIVEP